VADATDCDDTDAAVHPGASEVCDGADQDCDEEIDEEPVDAGSWYTDGDGDGYGDPATATVACTGPKGAIADGTDCDDAVASVHPGADEVCDGLDQDCDDAVDDDPVDGTTVYADTDGDGFGDPAVSAVYCELPADFVGDATDCDDGDATVYPGAEEVCDRVDQDCDGAVDPADCEEAAPEDKGCGCATGGDPSASWLAGLLVALAVRRRQVRHGDFTSR